MARRALVLAGLMALLIGVAPARAQDLPGYTQDQRWARAEYLVNAYLILSIRYGG